MKSPCKECDKISRDKNYCVENCSIIKKFQAHLMANKPGMESTYNRTYKLHLNMTGNVAYAIPTL